MSDGEGPADTPPITRPPAPPRNGGQTPPITRPPASSPADPAPPPAAPVTRPVLIAVGVAVVILSFVAAFLGATLARSTETESAPTAVTPSASAPSTEEYQDALEEILPAGAAVRVGTGVPAAGKGYEGEVYIEITTADVYLFRDGDWVKVGNIRASAAENLTGQTGPAGQTGAPGEAGASGAPGTPGTQLSLGAGAPVDDTCEADGDVYIDTEVVAFYECRAGVWTLFSRTAGVSPIPLPTPTTDSGG